MLEILQLPVLNDNYIYLLHDPESGETAAVDPAIALPVLDVLKDKNWKLGTVLNTHHHSDHVGGNLELKQKTGCKIIASHYDSKRIPGIDLAVSDGDSFTLGKYRISVLETPGHTLGHILFYCADAHALFCGDTLFAMGCGRLFEGSAEQMFSSLNKLKALPAETRIYCAHEYTQANARFALTVEPDNESLQARIIEINQLRKNNQPTIPTTLKLELATNPFLRTDSCALQQTINQQGKAEVDIFTRIRELKDMF